MSSGPGLIDATIKFLERIESALLVLCLSLMIGMAGYQVIARNFFDTGILWGDALVRVLVLWITFIGAMVASRKDEHIRMDLLTRFVPPVFDAYLKRFRSLFTAGIAAAFTWYSFEFVMLDYEDGVRAFASVPAWMCEVVMPLGGLVITLRYIIHTIFPPSSASP